MDDNQIARYGNLNKLVQRHHSRGAGDYKEEYDRFDATYLGVDRNGKKLPVDPDTGLTPIPRYASIASDETYDMINLFDKLADALQHQANIPEEGGEYLNVPSGIYDLDIKGDMLVPLPTKTIVVLADDFAMITSALDDAAYYRLGSDAANVDEIEDDDDREKYLAYLRLSEQLDAEAG